MARNQLPEGVGKKIVEALKRQAEADITLLDENNSNLSGSVPLTEIEDLPEVQPISLEEQTNTSDNDFIIEEEDLSSSLPEGIYKEKQENVDKVIKEQPVQQVATEEKTLAEQTIQNEPENKIIFHNETKEPAKPIPPMSFNLNEKPQEPIRKSSAMDKISIPANVLVLKNLIATLPVGVTKQTGAQIIRQTLEAMGLPINSVLKEAQGVQEELNSSTRECMLKIQEYKTNILQLEQSVQDYQRNISQINDLVSLFLLTEKK